MIQVGSQVAVEQIVDQIGETIFLINLTGQLQYLSRAWTTLTGYSIAESLGLPLTKFLHPFDVGSAHTLFAGLLNGSAERQTRLRLHTATDDVCSIEIHAYVMYDNQGQMQGIVGTLRNATDHNWAEEQIEAIAQPRDSSSCSNIQQPIALIHSLQTNHQQPLMSVAQLTQTLRNSQHLLCLTFDTLGHGLAIVDSNGEVLAINNALAAIHNSSRHTLVGQQWNAVCQPTAALLQAVFDYGQAQHNRVRFVSADQGVHMLDVRMLPLVSNMDRVQLVLIHVVDITEQVQMEAKLISQTRFATCGRLVASIAHEINTPLQAIESCLYLVETHATAHSVKHLHRARNEVLRVSNILHQLLDLFQNGPEHPALVDLNTLLKRILLFTAGMLADQNIAVVQTLDPDLPPLWGLGQELTQACFSLVLNAIQAMPNGGRLELCTKLLPATDTSSPRVLLDVIDTGVGIDPRLHTQIFDLFFTTKPGSFGLGLALCRQIIIAHAGEISVQSRCSTGSCFRISLPLQSAKIF